MDKLIIKLKSFLDKPAGVIIEAWVYAILLILILIFFTGNGQFIYEGF